MLNTYERRKHKPTIKNTVPTIKHGNENVMIWVLLMPGNREPHHSPGNHEKGELLLHH